MSLEITISVDKDTATPALEFLRANLTPQRMAHEIGPRATQLVQKHLLKNGPNKKGWPTTHFWARAAAATGWQEGPGFAMISINQVGVRQRFNGGPIKPVNARALTIPARADAYGKRARDFSNLKFAFAFDPEKGCIRAALVESSVTTGRNRNTSQTGSQSAGPNKLEPVFWLARGVRQDPDPTVLPSDDDFVEVIEQSVEALLSHPIEAN